MGVTVAKVVPGSPADKAGIRAGDELLTVNKREIADVLDYRFYIPDKKLKLTVRSGGKLRRLTLRKEAYAETGMEFETYLMDRERSCRNNCIFCFIDQLPPGMRESLYFKDDDSRLSFLFGNYITLTNLTEHEIARMIEMHISPVNVSVHTTNPELRCRMMNNRFAGDCLQTLRRFAEAGLSLQCQLVLVPGYNDGEELERSMADLAALAPSVKSVAAVPVGLTKYREGLADIRPFTPEEARDVIARMEAAGEKMLKETGSRRFYPADEWYLLAGLPVPEADFYEEFPQLENGVGMVALLRRDFREALASEERTPDSRRLVIATGTSAYPILESLMAEARRKWPSLSVQVVAIRNEFFGETITVSGLVTGRDLISQLTDIPVDRLLIPANMLRQEGDRFLDDVTPEEVRQALHCDLTTVDETDGFALCEALLGLLG